MMTDSTYELPRVLVSPDLFETVPMSSAVPWATVAGNTMIATIESEVPMTDEQALLKAQSIWGPTISLIRETSAGFWVKEAFIAMLWTADKASAEVVASSYRHSSCNDKPASWEAMFASVQEVTK